MTNLAKDFAALHVNGAPLVLFNVRDAGSARAVAASGARAIASGSWSVAAAQGHADGEVFALQEVLRTAASIVSAVDLPVSIDFEGGYGETPAEVAGNVARLMDTGAVGLNFEDRIVQGTWVARGQGAGRTDRRDPGDGRRARAGCLYQGPKSRPEMKARNEGPKSRPERMCSFRALTAIHRRCLTGQSPMPRPGRTGCSCRG